MAAASPSSSGARGSGSGWWGRQSNARKREHLETLLGLVGFFTLAALVTTVWAELSGRPALIEVGVLVLFLAAFYFTYRSWQGYRDP
ncbi:MAG: hypothetical protein H0V49_01780 [Nocardioidaceae bacterium]|nr:hypothetical protein [Nocardioidaceae bacterium]